MRQGFIMAAEQLFGGYRFGERKRPLMYSVLSDPEPFDQNAPDFMIPGSVFTYRYDIAVYLPRSSARRLSEKAMEKGVREPYFARDTLHSYLSSQELDSDDLPYGRLIKYVPRKNIILYQFLIENQDLDSLNRLAAQRNQPRWQTMRDIMEHVLAA